MGVRWCLWCDVLLSALVHVNCERQQHQYQSSKGLSPKNLENQNEDQCRSNLERGDEGVGNVSPHSTSPSELTSVLPWDPEGDKRLRCITSFFLFSPPPDFFSFQLFSSALTRQLLSAACSPRPTVEVCLQRRGDACAAVTTCAPIHLCLWRFTLLLVSDQVPHSSHSPWKSCLWGPLHPKKAPRRLRALSAGNSSSGALKSYIRHTSSAVAGTLTGRCKSHKDSLQDRTHINQHEEAAKILHSVVWEQPHRHVWLGTQSMGSHAYLPPKSSVDQGSDRRTDTWVARKNSMGTIGLRFERWELRSLKGGHSISWSGDITNGWSNSTALTDRTSDA